MLIDTREPPPPEPDPLEVDWPLVGWIVLCLALLVGAGYAPPLLGLPLALGGLAALAKVLTVACGGHGRGVQDWRQ